MLSTNLKFRLIFILFLFGFNLSFASVAEPEDSIISKLNKAIELKDKNQECRYTYDLASNYRFKGETDLAIEYSLKAIELAKETNDTTVQIHSLNILSINQQQKGEFDIAVENFNEAIRLAELLRDTVLLANSIENLSIVYGSTGTTDYPQALELLLKSVKLKEKIKAWDMLPGTYKNISTIFREIGDTTNRENYLLKAVDLVDRELVLNPSFQASVYNEAGRFYTDEKINYTKAEAYFNKVLEISEQLKWKRGIAVSLSNLANVKEKQLDFENAISIHEKALKLKQEMNDVYGLVNTYHSLGEILKNQHKYSLAIQNLEKAVKIASTNKMTNELKENYLILYELYREKNEWEKALDNFEKYQTLSDSLSGEKHKKAVAELETKYETEQKEQQIEQLTSEKKIESLKAQKRKLTAIVLGILVTLILVLAFFIIRHNKLQNKQSESELNQKLLRSQMNPHFIFNALGTIQNYIYNNKTDDAGKYLAKFAKLMRNILESSIYDEIPIHQEIETVNTYLSLQQIRDKNNFEFEIIEEGAMDDDKIPPMLVQPFIENSIKHGFPNNYTNGKILVKYDVDDDYITITVEDNGVGINSVKNSNTVNHKSYALKLTQQRLALFNKNKSKNDYITITDLSDKGGQGTRVEIHFKRI